MFRCNMGGYEYAGMKFHAMKKYHSIIITSKYQLNKQNLFLSRQFIKFFFRLMENIVHIN